MPCATSTSGRPRAALAPSAPIAGLEEDASRRATPRAARTIPVTRAPFEPTATRSPCARPSRCGVGRRDSSTRWRGCRNFSAGASRPRARPRSSGSCRAAGGRWLGAAAGGVVERERALLAGGMRGGLLALLPAQPAAADLLERDPGVERHGLVICARDHRAREHAEVVPEALISVGQHLPLGRGCRPGGRSPGAGAAGARRDA